MLVQSGEINGSTDACANESFLLMLAPVAPGSSRGPVINEIGSVIGVTTQELDGQYRGGSSFHYTAIPAINELQFIQSVSDTWIFLGVTGQNGLILI